MPISFCYQYHLIFPTREKGRKNRCSLVNKSTTFWIYPPKKIINKKNKKKISLPLSSQNFFFLNKQGNKKNKETKTKQISHFFFFKSLVGFVWTLWENHAFHDFLHSNLSLFLFLFLPSHHFVGLDSKKIRKKERKKEKKKK